MKKKRRYINDYERAKIVITFHVYGANVTIVGAATRSQLLASFARSPRPPLLRSRRSITSFSCTQHSALGAGTQLDAEPAPPSHTPAETQSRTSRSFFLHTIPATLSSALAASASRCSHTQAGHLQSRDNLPPSISSPVSARRVPAQHSTTRNARTQHTARDAEH